MPDGSGNLELVTKLNYESSQADTRTRVGAWFTAEVGILEVLQEKKNYKNIGKYV